MQLRRTDYITRTGFSLVETLLVLGITSIVLLVLTLALDASLGVLGRHNDERVIRSDVRYIVDSIKTDIEGMIVDRPSSYSFGDSLTAAQRPFLDRKRFIPVEINRTEGGDMEQTFVNSEAGYSALLFATTISSARYQHPLREQLRFSSGSGSFDEFNQSLDSLGEVGLCGYYVAYTRDSNRADSPRSLKLYRHFRSGGVTYGDGHANGVLAFSMDVFDPNSERTALTGSSWNNSQLPNVLAKRYTGPGLFDSTDITHPWPLFADNNLPTETNPPDFDQSSWFDPDHSIHDFVFGDEPIVKNILEFECVPYKKVETSTGVFELYNATDLNAFLGLSNSDWPILVKPDIIDISISVVAAEAAVLLEDRSDWSMPDMEVAIDQLSTLERLKRQLLQRYSIRVHIK